MLSLLDSKEDQRIQDTDFFKTAPSTRDGPRCCAATNLTHLIKLLIKLNGYAIKALLDLGLQANYVLARAAFIAGLRLLKKRMLYPIYVANGQPMPEQSKIQHEVILVPIEIHGH